MGKRSSLTLRFQGEERNGRQNKIEFGDRHFPKFDMGILGIVIFAHSYLPRLGYSRGSRTRCGRNSVTVKAMIMILIFCHVWFGR